MGRHDKFGVQTATLASSPLYHILTRAHRCDLRKIAPKQHNVLTTKIAHEESRASHHAAMKCIPSRHPRQ
jgi:hypothetical protein